AAALLREQPREAYTCTKFPPSAALVSRERDGFLEASFSGQQISSRFTQNRLRRDAMHFWLGPALSGFLHNIKCALERGVCRLKLSKLELHLREAGHSPR